MQKKILEKIIKSQLGDKVKKKKADFVVDTSINKSCCFNEVLKIIESIKNK
jgi:dephospho-CoA kinase